MQNKQGIGTIYLLKHYYYLDDCYSRKPCKAEAQDCQNRFVDEFHRFLWNFTSCERAAGMLFYELLGQADNLTSVQTSTS